jgi:hypothetical protein
MSETIGDILSSGGFTEAVKQAVVEIDKRAPPDPNKNPEPAPVTSPTPAPSPAPVLETKEEPKQAPQVTASDPAADFYKKFGVQGEEELRSSLTELETLRQTAIDFEAEKARYAEIEQQYEELMKEKDESSLFGSDEEYKIYKTATKFGLDKDFGVVQRLIRNDLNKLPDLDMVALQWQYEMPRFVGKDDYVKKGILKDVGVDVDDPDFDMNDIQLSPDQDLKLARMAQTARTNFNTIKNSVQIEPRVDPKQRINERLSQRQARVEQLNQSWSKEAKGIASALDKISITDKNEKGEDVVEFIYEVDAEFKDNIPGIIAHYAVTNNVDPTPENVARATKLLLDSYFVTNRDKIMKAYKNDAVTKLRDQLDKERFNGQPINKTEAPLITKKPDEAEEVNSIASQLFKR